MMDLLHEKVRVAVLLYRNRGLIASAIRWQTRGPWSHAALVFGPELYEAREFRGTLRRRVAEADLAADWFGLDVTVEQALAMEDFALAQVGKPYDYPMVLRFVSRRQAARRSSGKWFCSELVFACCHHVDVNLLARTEPWEVSPALLGRSPLLQPLTEEARWLHLPPALRAAI